MSGHLNRRRFRAAALFPLMAIALAWLAAPGGGIGAQGGAMPDAAGLFKDLRWRNIGPANMSGRVMDVEAVESNPAIVFVAAASGGVWKSVNAGTTWDPVFTKYSSTSIGDIGLYQRDPNIVWVGTGEGCVRNSSSWGDGIYKSTDGGKTFANMGLTDTEHIGRVVTHPTDPNIVYVAAQGHLWGYNAERGVYKTIDGGKTWRRLTNGLPSDNKTGAGDLVMDPANPNVLYAGMWERIRRPFIFESGGPNGGLFKTTNGGETWTKLTSGLPPSPTGKIGLSIYRRDPKIITAVIEAATNSDLNVAAAGIYRSEDAGATWRRVNPSDSRPFYFSHIYLDPNNANRVYMLAGAAQVSEDGGRTFGRNLQGIEGDFHALWIDPNNSARFYVANDKGVYVTYDGGTRFQMFDNMDIGQFYAVTADNRDPYYVYGGLQDSGNWGGPSNSRDFNGVLNDHWFKFHSGDGFHTTVDPNDWRTVYTEAQNGGIRRLDAVFRQEGKSIRPTPGTILNHADVAAKEGKPPAFRYNWSSPLILSPHDSKTLYFGGNYLFKSTDRGETWTLISPDLSTNDPEFSAPLGPNFLGERGGAETHATIISVVESPLIPGLIWAGTDDGNLQVTRDGGRTWTNVRGNVPATAVPARTWVSRVEPSHFDPATTYVSFDGHRRDDFHPYIVKTTDYGRTWTKISANLPAREPVYVVKEDLKNPNLLFAGTELGAYASTDGGRAWQKLMNELPTVAVHDLVIHPRDGDLIAATHGRSIWILDDITPLQQLTTDVMTADVHLFTNRVATIWKGVSRGATRGHMLFQGRNPLTIDQRPPANSPTELANSATVSYFVKTGGPAQLEIETLDGSRKFSTQLTTAAGINRYYWNMRFATPGGRGGQGRGGAGAGRGGGGGAAAAAGGAPDPSAADAPPAMAAPQGGAEPGTYKIRLTIGGKAYETTLTIRADPEGR
jgi:photosystem II stability/assembly factor-like uncharacterized protein